MKIVNSTKEDIPEIFRLYKLATDFHKIKFPENHWLQFDEAMVTSEVAETTQSKLVINNKTACVWAITYSNPQIWEDADNDISIFIHRIATNPDFRGNNFVKTIVYWAINLAKEHTSYLTEWILVVKTKAWSSILKVVSLHFWEQRN